MNLKRPKHPIPDFVKNELMSHGLIDVYLARPPYQQNDYIGWITRAKQETTKAKRLNQMIDELKDNDKYMKMGYHSKK